MQKDQDEFLRAIPSSIVFFESYEIQATVSEILKPNATRYSGEITINIPYSIWYQFRKNSLSRKSKFWKRRAAKSNHFHKDILKLSQYEKTNLDSIAFLSSNNHFLPLNSILLQEVPPYSLDSLNPACSICLPYSLNKYPIELFLEMKIFDEKQVEREVEGYKIQWENQIDNDSQKQIELTKQVAQQINKQVGFEDRLVLEISLSMLILYEFKDADDLPTLSKAQLNWPIPVSQRRIGLKVDEQNRAVIYNPKSHTVEWGGVHFEYLGFNKKTKKSRFELPLVKLEVTEPGEFFLAKHLDGKFYIDFPFLLSGIQTQVKNVFYDVAPSIIKKSVLVIEFVSFIEKLFERKIFSPYQHLQFPNVLLTEMRVADIVILLKDMYFFVINDPIPTEPEELDQEIGLPNKLTRYRQFLIEATKQDSGGMLKLWILVEGLPSGTTREKEIPGKEKFITDFPTGSTTIYIRGQLEGDSKRVVNVINEIHKKLKERFRHVSSLE